MHAIRNPAKDRDVEVTEDAAHRLFEDLRTMLVESPERGRKPHRGPYVEPVLLQVVCHRMWHNKCKDSAGRFDVLNVADLDRVNGVDKSLRNYYADVVKEAAGGNLRIERTLRDWVGQALITEENYRSQTRNGPAVRDPEGIRAVLQDRYLIRPDERAGSTWWELCHDRLIAPVREDNAAWLAKRPESWQVVLRSFAIRAHLRTILLVASVVLNLILIIVLIAR
jgi:hypothetical protein